MKIAKQVFSWIKERPYILYALKKDLINYSSLSRMIQKDLEIKNFDAVIVAVRRYQKNIDIIKSTGKEITDLLKKSRLEIKTGVNVYILEPNYKTEDLDYLHMIKGSHATTIITEKKLDVQCIKKSECLIEVKIISPPELESSTGFVAYVSSTLSEKGINIVEMYSCYTNTIFIFSKKDLSAVVETLEGLGVK
ncbi:MAG: ACT domain-containing protein [Candidatus Aenigmarchaeota archaeon]|nr:ACT domain-containing protein [Candidatus Aenigmarchaeota archaeon]